MQRLVYKVQKLIGSLRQRGTKAPMIIYPTLCMRPASAVVYYCDMHYSQIVVCVLRRNTVGGWDSGWRNCSVVLGRVVAVMRLLLPSQSSPDTICNNHPNPQPCPRPLHRTPAQSARPWVPAVLGALIKCVIILSIKYCIKVTFKTVNMIVVTSQN